MGVGAQGLAESQMGQGSGGQKGHMAGAGGEYRGERGWQGQKVRMAVAGLLGAGGYP